MAILKKPIIALDLDDTLVSIEDKYFWLEYVPKIAADRWDTSVEDAKRRIIGLYRMYPKNHLWFNPSFWEMIIGVPLEDDYYNLFIKNLKVLIPPSFISKIRTKFPVVISTNSPLWRAESILEVAGYEVDGLFTSDMAEAVKPQKIFYDLLARHLSAEPEDIYIFTDNPEEKIAEKYGFRVYVGSSEEIKKKLLDLYHGKEK